MVPLLVFSTTFLLASSIFSQASSFARHNQNNNPGIVLPSKRTTCCRMHRGTDIETTDVALLSRRDFVAAAAALVASVNSAEAVETSLLEEPSAIQSVEKLPEHSIEQPPRKEKIYENENENENERTDNKVEASSSSTVLNFTTLVHLEWIDREQPRSFAGDCQPITMNLAKVDPTNETLVALFGVLDPKALVVYAMDNQHLVEDSTESTEPIPVPLTLVSKLDEPDSYHWPLQAGHRYGVAFCSSEAAQRAAPPCSVRDICGLLGDDAETVIQQLSLTFYQSIWALDPDDDFRSLFVQAVENPAMAAEHQSQWLVQTWGGPPTASSSAKRIRAKHSSQRRMNFENAQRWLQHMHQAMAKVLPSSATVAQKAINLYWLSFFAQFPFSELERAQLRRLALESSLECSLESSPEPARNMDAKERT